MEWEAIETTYAPKKDERTRDEVLTEQAEERGLGEQIANYVSDVIGDVATAASHSKSPGEFVSALFAALTKGDRGLIFGTLLVVVSLSLLALQRTGGAPGT